MGIVLEDTREGVKWKRALKDFHPDEEALQLEPIDVCSYSPLALAYMGDAVYEF